MKLKTFVEEWVTSVKRGSVFEIFKNPNPGELKDLAKKGKSYVRYIIDYDKENIYVFSVNFLHFDAAIEIDKKAGTELKKMYINTKPGEEKNIFYSGKIIGGKITTSPRIYKKIKRTKIEKFFVISKLFGATI
ncbi:MAG TPA: hypothetical protein VMV95_00980 [Bacillota bacterium]|nr:hypothetical protein [Bacillota bacterium]